jgi:hypothetical protein
MEHLTNEIGKAVDHDPMQGAGAILPSKDERAVSERLAETGEEEMQRQEILHNSKPIFDIPPYDWDHRCDCCGKHVSELIPYGGPGDPLQGDHTGMLLVRQYRPMFDTRKEEKAFQEAQKRYEEDGFKDPEQWLINKYGKERAKEIHEREGVGYTTKSFECRDCAGTIEDIYFARREAAEKSGANPSNAKQVSNSPSLPLTRILPMHETNFIRVVLAQDNVLSLLSEAGIEGVSQVTMIEDRVHRYNRKSVKFEYTTEHDARRKRVVLDITGSEPSTEQVQNVVYELGQESDERIIVFADFGMNPERSNWNRAAIERLVSMMNDYGLRITLVRAIIDERHFRYSVLVTPHELPKEHATQCPSKERFSAVTFWASYYWQEGDIFDNEPFCIGFSEGYGCFAWTSGNRHIELNWGEQGAILSFIGVDQSDEYIQAFWSKRQKELRTACHGFEVQYITVNGEKPRINLRLLEIPVSALTDASVEEKQAYAALLKAQFNRIELLIKRLISDLESEGLEEVDHRRIRLSRLSH